MKFEICASDNTIELRYELDADDDRSATSLNAGRAPVRLFANRCSFRFPFNVDLPHPDACAFAAAKIAGPFIGSRLILDRPVSTQMGRAIRQEYKNIKEVNVSSDTAPLEASPGPLGLAYSGGSDSTAAAYLLPPDTKLISLVRESGHPDLGEIEPWHNGNQVDQVLDHMPSYFEKVPVFTDFPYTSLNPSGSFVVWADRMWHTIPVVLLAQHFGLGGVAHGNIMAAYLGNEQRFRSALGYNQHHESILTPLGLKSVQPLAGVSEFVSEKICRERGHKGMTLTCNFGTWMEPCMQCPKCLRKSLINHMLDGTFPSAQEVRLFNASKRVDTLRKKIPIPFTVTLKYLLDQFDMKFPSLLGAVQDKVNATYGEDPSWVTRVYTPFYESNRCVADMLPRLLHHAEPMTDADIGRVTSLDIRYKASA